MSAIDPIAGVPPGGDWWTLDIQMTMRIVGQWISLRSEQRATGQGLSDEGLKCGLSRVGRVMSIELAHGSTNGSAMVRKVRASKVKDSTSPSESSESSSKVNSMQNAFEVRDSPDDDLLVNEGEDTENLFIEKGSPEDGDPEVDQPVHEKALPDVMDLEAFLPEREGNEAGYNS
ncbi:hypothetical protein LWI28_023676 [Acer negundo]|uniref:Uncharacterized protein n=1 Tax=Acer negundo TaxID=4023 RepID=A0AAD5JU61_ACENE|nr:hypothetical protein LWI28_023676 [Acer negundo]